VPGGVYHADAGGLQLDGKHIETLVGVSTDAAAIDKLRSLGVTVASKTLKLDLGALLTELNDKGEFFGHDKIGGLATPDGGKTLVIAHDSDFGLAGIESQTPPVKLKPKMLANGRARIRASSSLSTPPNAAADPAADGIRQGRLTSRRGPTRSWGRAESADSPRCVGYRHARSRRAS
jgi:hypothetical protein